MTPEQGALITLKTTPAFHGSLKLGKAIVIGEIYDFATQKWVPTYKDETV
jgi:hypothetical protein